LLKDSQDAEKTAMKEKHKAALDALKAAK